MTQKLPWTPWHEVVKLREDVRTGELSLADFAADLHDVVMQKGTRPVYEDPGRFFALTYPTFPLRELARDVALRLAGRNTKAIRQLELTYGGGKTHALVALHHLVHDPEALPALSAVDQFRSHVGAPLPAARIAALCFDKLDVEKGMEVRGPGGRASLAEDIPGACSRSRSRAKRACARSIPTARTRNARRRPPSRCSPTCCRGRRHTGSRPWS